MFHYTKALPLALLVSLPIFAMDNEKPKVASELMDTIVATQKFEVSSKTCTQLLAERDELNKKVAEIASAKDEARTVIVSKVAEKDLTLAGILKKIEEQNEAKKAADAEKAQKETEFATFNGEYKTRVETISGKLAELTLEQTKVSTERKELQDVLDGTKKEVKASWRLLAWLGGSK